MKEDKTVKYSFLHMSILGCLSRTVDLLHRNGTVLLNLTSKSSLYMLTCFDTPYLTAVFHFSGMELEQTSCLEKALVCSTCR